MTDRKILFGALGGFVLGVSAVGGAVALVSFEPVETRTAAVMPEVPGFDSLPGASDPKPSAASEKASAAVRPAGLLPAPTHGPGRSPIVRLTPGTAVGSDPTRVTIPAPEVASPEVSPETNTQTPERPAPPTETYGPLPPQEPTPEAPAEPPASVDVSAWVWDQPWNQTARIAITVRNTGVAREDAQLSMNLPEGIYAHTLPTGCVAVGSEVACSTEIDGRSSAYFEVWLKPEGALVGVVNAEIPVVASIRDAVDQETVTVRFTQVPPPPPAPVWPSA